MRYDLTDFEWSVIEPATGRPARDERHFLGAANWGALARSAGALWPLHDCLQSLQPLAQGGRLGLADGRRDEGAWRPSADDR